MGEKLLIQHEVAGIMSKLTEYEPFNSGQVFLFSTGDYAALSKIDTDLPQGK